MPPLPPTPAVRVALIGTLGEDSLVVSRFYMGQNAAFVTPPANLNTFCTAVANSWNTNLAAQIRSDYTLTAVEAEDLSSATSPVGAAVVSHAGTRTGVKLSAGAAALLRFKIGRRYRGGHPRMYTPGGVQSDTTDAQTWNPTYLSGLVTAWNAFMTANISAMNTAYGDTGNVQENVSYYAGFTNVTYPSGRIFPRPTRRVTPTVDAVIEVDANPKIASQRRRNLTP